MALSFEQADISVLAYDDEQVAKCRRLFKEPDVSGVEPIKAPRHHYPLTDGIACWRAKWWHRKTPQVLLPENTVLEAAGLGVRPFLPGIVGFVHDPKIRFTCAAGRQHVGVDRSRDQRNFVDEAYGLKHVGTFSFRKPGPMGFERPHRVIGPQPDADTPPF
jgi:hypothetical protein